MRLISRTLLPFVFLIGLICLLRPVLAQYNPYLYISTSSLNAIYQTQALSAQARMAQQALDRVSGQSSSNSSGSTNRAPAKTTSQTAFRPGPQRLLVQSFSSSLSRDPAVVRQLVQAFNEGFKAFETEARRLGRPNNVAMAFTYLIGVCYLVHHGDEPAEAALMNLQGRLDALFGQSATFKKLTNKDRQQLYETLVLMATLPLAGYTVALEQKDEALMKTYRNLAGLALESALGVRPDRLKFTATSLELR
jgi:hypothetical protein